MLDLLVSSVIWRLYFANFREALLNNDMFNEEISELIR